MSAAPAPHIRLALLGALLTLAAPLHASAQHTFELGAGWQNVGATREMGWEPAIQGSRKDVPVILGWRYTGESRVYYAPSARLTYTSFWSVAGAGNLLGVELGPGGLGIYLSDPLGEVAPAARPGRWFVTLEVGLASLRLGANVTPDAPGSSEVPDPEARRASVREAVEADRAPEPGTQFYPFGGYSYVAVGLPIRFDAWGMIDERTGIGFYVESTVASFEWPMDRSVAQPAYGYSVLGGVTLRLFGAP